jgi:hypothetical protein
MPKLYTLIFSDDSGSFHLTDDDLEYLKAEKRRRENMGYECRIKKGDQNA